MMKISGKSMGSQLYQWMLYQFINFGELNGARMNHPCFGIITHGILMEHSGISTDNFWDVNRVNPFSWSCSSLLRL